LKKTAWKKLWNQRWQPKSGCGGLIMAKILITAIQANLCRRFTNFAELLLLKFLSLSVHHSHFWTAIFDFTSFHAAFFAWAAPFFLQFGYFYVDFTSFCNLTNFCFVAGGWNAYWMTWLQMNCWTAYWVSWLWLNCVLGDILLWLNCILGDFAVAEL